MINEKENYTNPYKDNLLLINEKSFGNKNYEFEYQNFNFRWKNYSSISKLEIKNSLLMNGGVGSQYSISEKTKECYYCRFFDYIFKKIYFIFAKTNNYLISKNYNVIENTEIQPFLNSGQMQGSICNKLKIDIIKLLGSGEISIEKIYSFSLLFQILSFFLLIIICLQLLPKLLSNKIFSIEKLSSYECGFAPFSSKSVANELHYLVVGIIFLVFDLEIIFIVPFIIKSVLTDSSIIIVLTYFLIISITVAIELKSGAISWPIWLQVNKKADKFQMLSFNDKVSNSWTSFLEKSK